MSKFFSKIVQIMVLGFSLLVSGCLPVGLPEPGWPAIEDASGLRLSKHLDNNRHLLIVAEESAFFTPQIDSPSITLGNQFLWVFPITRLFLQQGFQAFLLETVSSELLNQGFSLSIMSESSAKRLNPTYKTLTLKTHDLKISVYDFFISRRTSLSSHFSLCYPEPCFDKLITGSPVFSRPQPGSARKVHEYLKVSEWNKKGTPTQISSFLELSLKERFRRTFEKLEEDSVYSFISSKSEWLGSSVAPLIISLPNLADRTESENLVRDLGEAASASYNSPSFENYTKRGLSRAIQRGLHSAALELDYPVIASSDPKPIDYSKSARAKKPYIGLDSDFVLEKIEAKELILSFQTSLTGASPKQKTFYCRIRVPIDERFDGSLVRSLENLGNTVAKLVLTGKNPTMNEARINCT